MKLQQIRVDRLPKADELAALAALRPQLLLVFGAVDRLRMTGLREALLQALPDTEFAGCSTAGEIGNEGVGDGSLVLTALRFEHPALRVVRTDLAGMTDSEAAGARLAEALREPLDGLALRHVLVFGQGVQINGSALIAGLRGRLGGAVTISGGLAGDGAAFTRSYTLSRAAISDRQLVAIGLHDPRTQVRHGGFHGWQPFGPARKITRCEGNVLYELDGEAALSVYRRHLGDYASGLPGTGLLFPFEMQGSDHRAVGLIRTILGIDEARGSLVLAGDIEPQGYLRLMHASTDSLVQGAQAAAELLLAGPGGAPEGERLALLVSCVGRKLVMGQRVDEEVKAVVQVLGAQAQMTGFYSNGEISPGPTGLDCRLHNQTMTITLLSESA